MTAKWGAITPTRSAERQLNVVVLVEKRLALVSFRPALRIPLVVPLFGTVGCIGAMFIVNPLFSVAAVVLVLVFYLYLTRRHLSADESDVRSGLFVALSEWSAKRVYKLSAEGDRGWKPNLVVPVRDVSQLRGMFRLIRSVAYPKGSVKILGFSPEDPDSRASGRIERITDAFWEDDIFASWTSVRDPDIERAFVTSMETLRSAFFKPNVALLTYGADRDDELTRILPAAHANGLGVVLFADHGEARLGRRHWINVWFSAEDIGESNIELEVGEMDLAVLIALKLKTNWDGEIRLLANVESDEDKERAQRYLDAVSDRARLGATEGYVVTGDVPTALERSPQADISIFGARAGFDLTTVSTTVEQTRSACLFCQDAGFENALA